MVNLVGMPSSSMSMNGTCIVSMACHFTRQSLKIYAFFKILRDSQNNLSEHYLFIYSCFAYVASQFQKQQTRRTFTPENAQNMKLHFQPKLRRTKLPPFQNTVGNNEQRTNAFERGGLCFFYSDLTPQSCSLTILLSERPKLYTILAFLSAVGLQSFQTYIQG